jgi:hypothetical protein
MRGHQPGGAHPVADVVLVRIVTFELQLLD